MAEPEQAYDIVIIGAGTAGCVLANRLSEDPNLSVLLLEAGENRNRDDRVYTPALNGELLDNPDFDWQYLSTPQDGINGRRMKHPRGKVVGGSSAINSYALIYPNVAGLDVWRDLGNEGWGWEGMRAYYRKFVTVCPPSPAVKELRLIYSENAARRAEGPLQASFPKTVHPLHKAWVDTWATLGLENRVDPRDGCALGGYISPCHISETRRERSHAGVAFLEPVRERPNLHLITGALVQRIVFDESVARDAGATAIEYKKDGEIYRACVEREVLIAAGAFASPQILELSGIGNPDILSRHGIETVYPNTAVGENLQDHIRPGMSFEAADGVPIRDDVSAQEAREMYERDRTGPWADRACYTFANMPLQPFLSDEDKETLAGVLDHHLTNSSSSDFERKRNQYIRRMIEDPSEATATGFLARSIGPPDPAAKNWITLFASLSHPFSRGSVHITSSDPTVKAAIDPGYYTHPLDLEIHARHLQSLEILAETKPLASKIKQGGARLPADMDASTLSRAKELLRAHVSTNYHPCGTCSMMPESLGGVVDSGLKVYGTKNVRVVDASMMPIIPRANIITTVYAVAEKAADIVSADLGLQRST